MNYSRLDILEALAWSARQFLTVHPDHPGLAPDVIRRRDDFERRAQSLLADLDKTSREANARLFLRAQHMDELVQWVTRLIDWEAIVTEEEELDQLKAFLAKIEGEKG